MRINLNTIVIGLSCLILVAGCAQPLAGTFTANDLAMSTLANTTWTGPAGNVSLTFDKDARLTGLSIQSPQTELTSLSFTTSPFTTTVTLPQNSPVYPGQTLTITMSPTKTELYSDNTFLIEFQATVAQFPQIDHFTLTITGSLSQATGHKQITSMNVSLTATVIVLATEIVVPVYSTSIDTL